MGSRGTRRRRKVRLEISGSRVRYDRICQVSLLVSAVQSPVPPVSTTSMTPSSYIVKALSSSSTSSSTTSTTKTPSSKSSTTTTSPVTTSIYTTTTTVSSVTTHKTTLSGIQMASTLPESTSTHHLRTTTKHTTDVQIAASSTTDSTIGTSLASTTAGVVATSSAISTPSTLVSSTQEHSTSPTSTSFPHTTQEVITQNSVNQTVYSTHQGSNTSSQPPSTSTESALATAQNVTQPFGNQSQTDTQTSSLTTTSLVTNSVFSSPTGPKNSFQTTEANLLSTQNVTEIKFPSTSAVASSYEDGTSTSLSVSNSDTSTITEPSAVNSESVTKSLLPTTSQPSLNSQATPSVTFESTVTSLNSENTTMANETPIFSSEKYVPLTSDPSVLSSSVVSTTETMYETQTQETTLSATAASWPKPLTYTTSTAVIGSSSSSTAKSSSWTPFSLKSPSSQVSQSSKSFTQDLNNTTTNASKASTEVYTTKDTNTGKEYSTNSNLLSSTDAIVPSSTMNVSGLTTTTDASSSEKSSSTPETSISSVVMPHISTSEMISTIDLTENYFSTGTESTSESTSTDVLTSTVTSTLDITTAPTTTLTTTVPTTSSSTTILPLPMVNNHYTSSTSTTTSTTSTSSSTQSQTLSPVYLQVSSSPNGTNHNGLLNSTTVQAYANETDSTGMTTFEEFTTEVLTSSTSEEASVITTSTDITTLNDNIDSVTATPVMTTGQQPKTTTLPAVMLTTLTTTTTPASTPATASSTASSSDSEITRTLETSTNVDTLLSSTDPGKSEGNVSTTYESLNASTPTVTESPEHTTFGSSIALKTTSKSTNESEASSVLSVTGTRSTDSLSSEASFTTLVATTPTTVQPGLSSVKLTIKEQILKTNAEYNFTVDTESYYNTTCFIDFGDNITESIKLEPPIPTFAFTHSYDDKSEGRVWVSVRCHDHLSEVSDGLLVEIVKPLVGFSLSSNPRPVPIPPGLAALALSFADYNYNDQAINTTWDFGDGFTERFELIKNDSTNGTFEVMHNYQFSSAPLTVTVLLYNKAGVYMVSTKVYMEVVIVGAKLEIIGSTRVSVDSQISFYLTFQNGSNTQLTVDFGDGTVSQVTASNGTTISHVFKSDDNYTVVGRLHNAVSGMTVSLPEKIIARRSLDDLLLEHENHAALPVGHFAMNVSAIHDHLAVQCIFDFGKDIVDRFFPLVGVEAKANLSYSYAGMEPGIYPLIVNCSNNISDITFHKEIIVVELIGSLSVLVTPTLTQTGDPVVINVTLTRGSNVTYLINYGDGVVENRGGIVNTTMIIRYTYNTSGNFTIQVSAFNFLSRAIASASIYVVEPIEGASFNHYSTDLYSGRIYYGTGPEHNLFNVDRKLALTCNTTSGTNLLYFWELDDGQSKEFHTTKTPVLLKKYYKATNVSVRVTITNGIMNVTQIMTVVLMEPAAIRSFANNGPVPSLKNITYTLTIKNPTPSTCILLKMHNSTILQGAEVCKTIYASHSFVNQSYIYFGNPVLEEMKYVEMYEEEGSISVDATLFNWVSRSFAVSQAGI
ncbi:hypothetical protein SK128_022020 [Halocaridina rubra]|uniref:PKD domain-containing protein n=1 Tax=Halocaridina rubra TaxID=373956 RepID=A0AAN9A0P2_HALRR